MAKNQVTSTSTSPNIPSLPTAAEMNILCSRIYLAGKMSASHYAPETGIS
jgi:hypothetical protein